MNKINKNYCCLTPAYGRDYKNKKDAEADFRAGKDFQIQDTQLGNGYCSIRDFESGVTVELRYKSLTMLTMVKV
jgi:hypothetical protein